jgi:hypothetical protein
MPNPWSIPARGLRNIFSGVFLQVSAYYAGAF